MRQRQQQQQQQQQQRQQRQWQQQRASLAPAAAAAIAPAPRSAEALVAAASGAAGQWQQLLSEPQQQQQQQQQQRQQQQPRDAAAPFRRLQGARPSRRARRLRRRLQRRLRLSRQGQGRRGSWRGARAGIVGGRAQLVLPPPSGGRPRPVELREAIKRSNTYCGVHRGSGPTRVLEIEQYCVSEAASQKSLRSRGEPKNLCGECSADSAAKI